MKKGMLWRYQVTGFIVSMPLISFALSYILYGKRIYEDWRILCISIPIIYFFGFLSWRLHEVYDSYLRKKFPTLEQTRKRILFKALVNIFIMTPSVVVIFLFFHIFDIFHYRISFNDLKYGFFTGLAVNIVFESLWEVLYIIEVYKGVAAERERILELQLEQEFDNLKQKVNPHFLFNSFNTLSSLINIDRKQAEKFLDELSKVYRYLLYNNERGLNTLEQETDFIRSYYGLLKTRFGDGLLLEIDIDPSMMGLELPSLSLQLLVENAVKHNVISKSKPVHVKIYTIDHQVVVENNLNVKKLTVDSTGIGLSSIKMKYALLQQNQIEIEKSETQFKVILPLIG